MKHLIKSAHTVYKDCVELKPKEKVLVITDEPLRRIGYVFWKTAKDLGAEAMITEIITRTMHGTEPPCGLEKLMQEVDVLLIPTSKSMTHTQARKKASEAGVRGATLPGITEDIMKRTLTADYRKIAKLTKLVASELEKTKEVHVKSSKGTDILLPVSRKAKADTGIINKPGKFSNLPAGEAYLAPDEGKSNGIVVIDGSMSGIGKLKHQIILHIKKGFVVKIEGKEESRKLQKIISPYGKMAKNIAEFGVGTNNKAKLSGNILEDEKVLGSIHIALGNNFSFGGTVKVPIHLDGIVLNPTVLLDGRTLMKNGRMFL